MRLDVVRQFMSHFIAVRSRLPALLVAIISVACGQATADNQAITTVSVTITVPPAMSQALPPLSGSGKSYAPIPSVLALVDSVSLSVIDSANQPVMDATTVPISAGQTVPVTLDVLTGPARTFVGQAMDTQGTVLFQGRSSPVDLDGKPVSVGIAMTLNSFPLDLHVVMSGSGSGTVTSSPTGINCGGTCSAPFTLGTDITLTATPDATSTFTGWTGAACAGTGICTVSMTATQTVTATFTRTPYALTVTKTGTGTGTVTSTSGIINCGSACSAQFDAGTSVTLIAEPDLTSTFAGWTGCTSSTGATCTVTINAAGTVTATFTLNTYTLTLTTAGTGSGTVTGAGSYSYGTTAPVTATATTGSTFAGWSGPNGTECATGAVSMVANKSCTATFTRIQYLLIVAKDGTGGGIVSSLPVGMTCGTTTCSASFDAGSSVTLIPTADATSTFAGWTGCASSTGTICLVTDRKSTRLNSSHIQKSRMPSSA